VNKDSFRVFQSRNYSKVKTLPFNKRIAALYKLYKKSRSGKAFEAAAKAAAAAKQAAIESAKKAEWKGLKL
jgi:hypothetical protein